MTDIQGSTPGEPETECWHDKVVVAIRRQAEVEARIAGALMRAREAGASLAEDVRRALKETE